MKTIKKILAIAAILSFGSCDLKEESYYPSSSKSVSLLATLEQPMDTRTTVQEDGSVYWDTSERIKVFCGDKSAAFTSVNDSPAESVSFIGSIDISPTEENVLWALYPYDEDATLIDGIITTRIPEDQVACAGSFARNTNVTVARSSTASLQFYNVCGGVRFSISQEGIKKVIFEGLNNESIAGKIKIAFDENDRPYIKEVLDGRLFITLTPPDGETFQTGQWYYISALPGALEKGFKIRFYKDDTYAKRVSENAVTIKRSVFGSLKEPDKGTNFIEMTSHFPETEEDIVRCNAISESIAPIASAILFMATDKSTGEVNVGQVITEVGKIEGVLSADLNESETAIIIRQSDNTFINLLIENYDTESIAARPTLARSGLNNPNPPYTGLSKISEWKEAGNGLEYLSPKNKNTLLLAPFHNYTTFNKREVTIDYLTSMLESAGFSTKDNVLLGSSATINAFEINNLSQYGIVIVCTHGGNNCKTIEGNNTTLLVSGTTLGELRPVPPLSLFRHLGKAIISDSIPDCYYCLTVPWMNACATSSTDFKDALVFLSACHSTEDDDLRNCLFSYNIGACCGYADSIHCVCANYYVSRIFNQLTYGADLSLATENANNSVDRKGIIDSFHESGTTNLSFPEVQSFSKSDYSSTYSLYNLKPYNLNAHLTPPQIELSWSIEKRTIPEYSFVNWKYAGYKLPHLQLCQRYDIFVDDSIVDTTFDLSTSVNNLAEGKHTWYVITRVVDGETELGSFKSDTEEFEIQSTDPPKPVAVDLGLSVKWASCNIGATRPEEYGYYYAWGEIEPKDDYSWATYKWCGGTSGSITKYNEDEYYGAVDNKTTLDLEDDVAHVKWGEGWRIPTDEEWIELIENCSWKWTDEYSGPEASSYVTGYFATSKVPGYTDKSIFFPSAGFCYGSTPETGGIIAYYWSSSLFHNSKAWVVVNPGGLNRPLRAMDRSVGVSVRSVRD